MVKSGADKRQEIEELKKIAAKAYLISNSHKSV